MDKLELKHYLLLLCIPLSEAKAIFYSWDTKVDWYLFSDNKRYLCNVVEDYSNILIFALLFWFLRTQNDKTTQSIGLFLFVLNALDFVHLGLYDMQYFILVKLIITYFICNLANRFWFT